MTAITDTTASAGTPTANGAVPAGMLAAQRRIAEILGRAAGGTGAMGTSFADLLSAAAAAGTVTTGTTDAGASGAAAAAVAARLRLGTAGTATSTGADAVIGEARGYLGVPYVWGGTTPAGFDCSGLVQYVYGHHGVSLPRVAADQARAGTAVTAAGARPGDLVFFGSPVDHVGIYLGNGQMLDAPHTGAVVRVEPVDLSTCTAIRRVLPDAVTPTAQARTSTGDWASALPAAGQQWSGAIEQAARAAGIQPQLLAAVAWQESGFQPNVVSGAGAIGLTQLMPGTAAGLGVDPRDPAQNLAGGARYLAAQLQRFGGRTDLALAAYNAGPGAVQRYGGVPPYAETQNYVRTVLAHLDTLNGGGSR